MVRQDAKARPQSAQLLIRRLLREDRARGDDATATPPAITPTDAVLEVDRSTIHPNPSTAHNRIGGIQANGGHAEADPCEADGCPSERGGHPKEIALAVAAAKMRSGKLSVTQIFLDLILRDWTRDRTHPSSALDVSSNVRHASSLALLPVEAIEDVHHDKEEAKGGLCLLWWGR